MSVAGPKNVFDNKSNMSSNPRYTVHCISGWTFVFLISAIRILLDSTVAFATSWSPVASHQFETLYFKA